MKPKPSSPVKKKWGQHFLSDATTSKAIVALLQNLPLEPVLLEIGPGKGALTQWLLHSDRTFKMIEIDADMIKYLGRTYKVVEEHLIHADFVGFPLEQITTGRIILIGNLPYNVGSQILFHSLRYTSQITHMIFMLQKEVAQRIASPPGSKQYGILSVLLQAFYKIEYCFEVPPTAFIPPPKVTSAVIRLHRYRTHLPCDDTTFQRVVKTAFQQRRKMLKKALKSLNKPLEKIPLSLRNQRAEQLKVEDFISLVNSLYAS